MLYIISAIAGLLALFVIIFLIVKKVPHLRILDIESLKASREKRIKQNILMNRLERLGGEKVKKIVKFIKPAGSILSAGKSRIKEKVKNLENQYQKIAKELGSASANHAVDVDAIKRLLEEAASLASEGNHLEAEKRYIEVISHSPKNTAAYEDLGNLYLDMKQYEQAKESLSYALKIKPNDASVLASLGEVSLRIGNANDAKAYFERATSVRPNNPKYLDFYIQACIDSASPEEARHGLERLREVNPENQKLDQFEEAIKKLEQQSIANK
ncbi:MAG: hypothetical protein ACD_76C00134G0007 [uncultured bacterium]|nr:MAG: hypothetical protein ACD_76C00134G0007 [uncultured bacterium]HBD04836.1 hypothetical protein [Candidatus Uhrbacteria bacterium]